MRFKKGDYVRIRSWEEMVKEFGIDNNGEVDTPRCSFTEGMKDYCGEIRKVSAADHDDTYQMEGIDFYWFPEDSLLPAKKQRALRVGDRVLVRSWDSMEEEFGTDGDGDIDSLPCFSTSMRQYCGEEMTVSDAGISFVNLEGADYYTFSPKHVTLVEPAIKEGDVVQIKTWDSMREEFGLDNDGNIDTPSIPFLRSSAEMCGKTVMINYYDNRDDTFMGNDLRWYPKECIAKVTKKGKDNEAEEVTGSATGLASDQEHYKASAMQPLEVMQAFFTPEQFKGFLLGNFVKYTMRAMHKGQAESDHDKAKQYLYWYSLVKNDADYRISPETDVPDDDFTGEGVFA